MNTDQVVLTRAARKKLSRNILARKPNRQKVEPWLLLTPIMVLVAGFVLYPVLHALWISVHDVSVFQMGQAAFVGLGNFAAAFTNPDFLTALRNSGIWTFGSVAIQLFTGTIGAVILNQRIRGRGVIRGLVLLPWATPSVLAALMFLWILDPNRGIADNLLGLIGYHGPRIAWLSNPHTALPSLMFIDIWQGIPFFAVMILAALQSVPSDLQEAAKIDGASSWRSFTNVTLPLIMPTILITTILRLIWTANYMDLALVLTSGGPGTSTLTLPLLSYLTAYKETNFGEGSAFAVIQVLILLVLVFFYFRQLKRSELV
jgi:multiple sugar transport system permease protein